MLKNTIYFSEQIFFNDTPIYISRKKIKNMYLRVRSPHADIHISAPKSMSIHRIKIFLTEKKHWIDAQKQKILLSNTEKPKCIQALCTEGAIHSLWGETHTLHIQYTQTKPYVQVYDDEKKMLLYVSTDTPVKKYADTT